MDSGDDVRDRRGGQGGQGGQGDEDGEAGQGELLRDAVAIAAQVVADRRAIHRQPELSFQEHRTAALVAERLAELGLEVRTGVAETGVIGLLRGGRPGKTVLLRADMDALPVQEETGLPFASEVPGRMHACGHDAHTAILLGAARLLAARRERLAGNVKLMFQPAEEDGGGAQRMIDEGVLDGPPVDAAFGLHSHYSLRSGTMGIGAGPLMASADRVTITVRGRGGHAAYPHDAVDPIVVAGHLITALQTLVSREVSPARAAVVTIGSVVAGTAGNVIPETATLDGTTRSFDPQVRAHLERRIAELCSGIAGGMRATAEVSYERGYPPLVNDAAMAQLAASACREALGAAAVHGAEPMMGAEDFAYLLERVPGAFMYWGVRAPEWQTERPYHSSGFMLDEAALPTGVAAMVGVTLRYLESA